MPGMGQSRAVNARLRAPLWFLGQKLLVGSPWSGYPVNRTGDIYACPVGTSKTTFKKLNLQALINILNVTEIKEDMNLGLTLIQNSKTGGFLVGLIQYANNPHVVFNLNTYQTKDEVVKAMEGTYQKGGDLTNTFKAIDNASHVFEKILQDRNHSSYLGYSVAVPSTQSSVYFVAGAPRSNYAGRVVVYGVDSHGNITIVQSQRGKQIGSYFGSVVCSVDVNRDSVTDVLLVGAPMFMNDLKKEEGRVYMFSITKGILDQQELLEGPQGSENARITTLADIDLDGFNDVVIGAPLENQNSGAIYIYNGFQKTIITRYSQKILGSDSAFGQQLQFFGRSVDGHRDLDDDDITGISVSADGNVVLLWSQNIANVSIIASFKPEKISLLNKNTEITVKICFQATFRPAKINNQMAIKYNATLDADLQSSRVTSRGLFKENNERYMQRDLVVRHEENCVHDVFSVQEPSDAVNSLSLCIDIGLENPGSSPVLDIYSPASVAYSICFIKDCGEDELCICDLVLNVQQKADDGKQQFVVSSKNRRIMFNVKLRNKKENAYNTRIQATFSDKLVFASSSLPARDVTCQAQINPLQIGKRSYSASFKKENFRASKELNCKNAKCSTIACKLEDLMLKGEYFVNVSTRIWNGTFAASTFQTLQLSAEAEIYTHNPELFIIGENTLTIPVTIMKPDENAETPVGVVIGSILAGLLLLLVLVAVLWKLSFFKTQYEKMTQDLEDINEITELTKDKD
ncbi:LOW QUALITY PROTEIN: integrin alpha-2-like [Sarcoramphus papa]